MQERRKYKRVARRFKVRFGEVGAGFDRAGFTSDVSAGGLFLAGPNPKLGARIHMEITADANRVLYQEAVVQRLAVLPPELRATASSGFGVRFVSGTQLLAELIPSLREQAKLQFTYTSREQFKTAFENDFKRGGLFAKLDTELKVDSTVAVEIELAWARRSMEFNVRVVHVAADATGQFGTSLVFADPPEAAKRLQAVLEAT